MNKVLVRPYVILLFCLGMLSTMTAHAIDYQIEVVIFETASGRQLNAGGLYYPKSAKSLTLNTEAALTAGFALSDNDLTLTDNARSMASSGRYRVLRHFAWRQPGLDESSAVPIRIAIGTSTPVYLPERLSSYDNFIPASLSPTGSNKREATAFTVNGTIKVRLGRFLHMDAKLVYTDPETGQGFRLAQSRKMRSRELHYIDNPRFGILTRIVPLEDKLLPE